MCHRGQKFFHEPHTPIPRWSDNDVRLPSIKQPSIFSNTMVVVNCVVVDHFDSHRKSPPCLLWVPHYLRSWYNTFKMVSEWHSSLISCGESITLSWHGFSQGSICLRPLPSALSTSRIDRTSSANSGGSSEAAWSLPFHVLSKVT